MGINLLRKRTNPPRREPPRSAFLGDDKSLAARLNFRIILANFVGTNARTHRAQRLKVSHEEWSVDSILSVDRDVMAENRHA